MTGPLLEVVGITKRYAGIAALSDVGFGVDEGDFLGLLGPNGAGKTTLFDCLTGRQRPDGGRVLFKGVDVTAVPVHRRARMGIARTFQRMEPFSGMTVRDHLLVADRAHRGGRGVVGDLLARLRPDPDERRRCDDVLDVLGLGADADRPIDALSLGRGRLVELGRALMTEPDLLFLDEPSSGLDGDETHEMGSVLLDVQARSGATVVLVEHDVPMVQRLTRTLVVLDAGSKIAEGPTGDVLADPLVRQAYLGVGT